MKNIQKYLIAALLIASGLVALAVNNLGDAQSIVVRRPKPNLEVVVFGVTNGQTSSLVWTSSLNKVSANFVDRRATAGTVMTNLLTVTTAGSVLTAAPVGAFEAGKVAIEMVE